MTNSPESPSEDDSIEVQIEVLVPGEGILRGRHRIDKVYLETPRLDVVDSVLNQLMQGIRKTRQLRIHGKCAIEGCGRPRTPAPQSDRSDLCQGHDYDLHRQKDTRLA